MEIETYILGVKGFEPLHHDIKNHCLTAWLYPKKASHVFLRKKFSELIESGIYYIKV